MGCSLHNIIKQHCLCIPVYLSHEHFYALHGVDDDDGDDHDIGIMMEYCMIYNMRCQNRLDALNL